MAEGKGRLKDKCKHVKSCSQLIFKDVGRGDQEMELNQAEKQPQLLQADNLGED